MTQHDHHHTHNHDHNHDDHSHGHGHGHGHRHSHAPAVFDRAFAAGIALNLGFVAVEGFYGLVSHSLALVSDAGHNLSDVASLALAWGASWLSRRKPSKSRTYGYARSSILASLINAVLLLVVVGAIGWQAVLRLLAPAPVAANTVMWVALAGIAVNTLTALMFLRGKDGDINIKGAYLHMAADAGVSLGVVIGAVVIGRTGWLWLDPLMSLAIIAVIALGTFDLLRESVDMAMDAVPRSVDLPAVERYLSGLPGVLAVHDLHIWPLSTTSIALTAHLVTPDGHEDGDGWLAEIGVALREKFGIDHPTIQVERGADCRLAPACVI